MLRLRLVTRRSAPDRVKRPFSSGWDLPIKEKITMTTPVPAAAPADYPGKTLGIVAVILAFVFTLLGLILGIVANNQSKAAGFKNTPAKVAIILSIVFMVLGVLIGIIAAATGTWTVSSY